MTDAFAPAKLGPLTLRNRIIKAATFEGVTPKRVVTDELIEFHQRVAAGGTAMSTVAYCAVSREGSTDGRTIVLAPEAVDGLRRLTDAIHAEGAAACAQVGHAGPVANPAGTRSPALAPSRFLTPIAFKWTKAMDADDFARVTQDFIDGSRIAVASGFDALEIHLGHNYLLSSFMSPKLNRRRDEYGGTVENRARFPRHIVRSVRDAVGPDVAVTAKFNMDDGVTGGLLPEDALEIASLLQQDGCLDALELTGGSSLRNPMYLFRGDVPLREFAQSLPPVMKLGFRVFGRRFFKAYPFEEAYFLQTAKRFRDALDIPLILLGGINKRSTIDGAIAAGFNFVAMGRALLMEPDLVNRMRDDPSVVASCIHCNRCMPTIYTGTHCVLTEPGAQG